MVDVAAMISDVEDYFANGCGRCPRFATPDCSARRWRAALAHLRRICLEEGLEETLRWGHPCYRHAGRNVAILGAVRGDVRLSFFNAALMTDPDGLLEKQGPHTQWPDMLRFTGAERVAALEGSVRAYLREAMGYAAAGAAPPKKAVAVEPPEELLEAFAADLELAEAFHRLTPGRQRSYVIYLSSAKKPETRRARIGKVRPKILSGKGATER